MAFSEIISPLDDMSPEDSTLAAKSKAVVEEEATFVPLNDLSLTDARNGLQLSDITDQEIAS